MPKISALPSASAANLNGTDKVPLVDGTTTKYATMASARTRFLAGESDFSSTDDLGSATYPVRSGYFSGTVFTAASGTGAAGLNLPHGSAPTAPNNGDVWTTTSGIFVRINGSTVGPLGTGGGGGISGSGTTGKVMLWTGSTAAGDSAITEGASDLTSTKALILPASTTSIASLQLPHGSAPTAPTNGELWTTTAGLYVRINGSTVGPLGSGGGSVSSVFGRTGAVVAQSGDYDFSEIGSTPTTLSGYGITDAAALAGATFTGTVVTVASGTGAAGFRLPHGAAPTSPTNGDVWTTTAGMLARINGSTVTFSVTGHVHAASDITSGTIATARLGSGTADSTTFLRGDGSWQSIPGGGDALTSSPLSQFAATTSAQLAGVISDETGSGALVFAGGPTFTGTVNVAALTATGLVLTAASATGSAGLRLPHGAAPTSPTNGDTWTTTAAMFVRLNGTTATLATLAGGTYTGTIVTVATGTGAAGLRLPHGTAPSSPTNGDVWTTTTGLYVRINGATVGPLVATVAGSALTGTSLASGIVSSSLTSVGTLTSLTLSGLLLTVASGTGSAGFRLPHGSAPTSPTNGDVWTTTGGLFARINGTTQQALWLSGGTMTGTLGMADQLLTQPYLQDYAEVVNAAGNISGATNISYASGNHATATLTGNTTVTITNPPASGRSGTITLEVTGNGTATFAITNADYGDQGAPSAAIPNGEKYLFFCNTIDAGTTWRVTWAGGY